MYTYQDWEDAVYAGEEKKLNFIQDSVNWYRNSVSYRRAVQAREYYMRRNTEICKRRETLLSTGAISKSQQRATRPVNRKCCGFFSKSVNQLCMYLLGNGVNIQRDIKVKLGENFDIMLQKIGKNALIDGVCWGYWEHDSVIPFYATEFISLPDERTSEVKAGFRFYQIDERKPLFIEVFEIDGVTVYKVSDGKMTLVKDKQPYVRNYVRSDSVNIPISVKEYSVLPIVPFYASDAQESFLNDGLKNDIDLYDRIMSDFGDNLDRANDIYYVVQNYGGANLKQLIEEIEEYKTIYTDGESGAQIKTIEVPYAARSEALRLLERQMYKETQTLDTEELSGGGLTNVAIKAAMTELDLKADMYEWQALSYVKGILKIVCPEKAVDVSFTRRSLVNDSETIGNIYLMRGDIDQRMALELNPLLSEEQVETLLERACNSVDSVNKDNSVNSEVNNG